MSFSVGKFSFLFGLVRGFLMGILLTIGLGKGGDTLTGSPAPGISAGLVRLVLIVIVEGVVGFTRGAIVAIMYILVPGATGGIRMDLEAKTQTSKWRRVH